MGSLLQIVLGLFNIEKMMCKRSRQIMKIFLGAYLYVHHTTDSDEICEIINISTQRMDSMCETRTWKKAVSIWGGSVDIEFFPGERVSRNSLKHVKNIHKDRLYDIQEGKCASCKDHLHQRHLTIDHITPICRGGTHNINNLQLLCNYCNTLKGKGTNEDLIRELERQGILIGANNYYN